MRIPTTEARRNPDTGAGTLSTPRITDAVGPSMRSVGGALVDLGERYQRQQDTNQTVRARKSFLDFQTAVQEDYRASLEEMPENGEGHFNRWFVGNDDEPGRFHQHFDAFIAALPPHLQDEYGARATEVGGQLDNIAARDELTARQSFTNSVITQQMEVSVAAISQNPGTFEDQLEDVQTLVVQSGLPVSEAAELLQASEQQLALIAARVEMERDPDAFSQALDDHQSRYGARRIEAAFDAVAGDGGNAGIQQGQEVRRPTDDQVDAQRPESPIATRRNIRSRVQGAFEAVEQGEGQEALGNRYAPILQRLEPSQIDDLRFELEDARFEEKRRADYNAAALRRALGDNLKSIRETGWPAQDIDAREVKSLLGEEEAKTFESDQVVARTTYRAVQATAGLPEEEVRPEIERIVARSGGDPDSAEAVIVETFQQRQMQQDLQERDPARWATGHPNVQEALGANIWANPEDMEALVGALLTAQAVGDVPEEARQPVPQVWAQQLGNHLNSTLAHARRKGVAEFDAMRVAVETIRSRFGDRYAQQVTTAAIETLRDPGNLPVLADRVFAMTQLNPGEVHPVLTAGQVDHGVENFSRTFTRLSDTQRARYNTHDSAAAIHLGADFRQGMAALDDMPRMAWPPFDTELESDTDTPASGLKYFREGASEVWEGFQNLGSSISRGTTGLVSDASRGVATIPNQWRRFNQDNLIYRMRDAPFVHSRARAGLQRDISNLRYIDPGLAARAQAVYDAVLDGRLQPENLRRDMVFQELPSLEDSALMGIANSLDEFSNTHMPLRPGWEDHYTTYIGEFIGREGPLLLVSLNGPYQLSRIAAGVSTEVLAGRGEMARRAMDAGASDEAVLDAMALATVAGFVGATPIDILMQRSGVREIVWQVVRDITDSGALDVTQGISHQVLENLAVQLAYDEDQGLLDGALEAGIESYANFLASQILEGATTVLTRRPIESGSERSSTSDGNPTITASDDGLGSNGDIPSSIGNDGAAEPRPLQITVTPAPPEQRRPEFR